MLQPTFSVSQLSKHQPWEFLQQQKETDNSHFSFPPSPPASLVVARHSHSTTIIHFLIKGHWYNFFFFHVNKKKKKKKKEFILKCICNSPCIPLLLQLPLTEIVSGTPSVYLEEVKQGGHLAMEIIPQLRPGFAFPTH